MMRYSLLIFVSIIALGVFGLFKVKFKVQDLRKNLALIEKKINQEKTSIHVLSAEWTYLNQPERISKLAAKYLKLEPMKLSQIHKSENGLPVYLSEDNDKRDLYLASIEFNKYNNNNKKNNIMDQIRVQRVKSVKTKTRLKLTNTKY